jgi:hypothetical protein
MTLAPGSSSSLITTFLQSLSSLNTIFHNIHYFILYPHSHHSSHIITCIISIYYLFLFLTLVKTVLHSFHITNITHFHPTLLSVSDSPSQSYNQFPFLPRSLPTSWDAGLYLLRYRFTNEVCMDNLLRFLLRD